MSRFLQEIVKDLSLDELADLIEVAVVEVVLGSLESSERAGYWRIRRIRLQLASETLVVLTTFYEGVCEEILNTGQPLKSKLGPSSTASKITFSSTSDLRTISPSAQAPLPRWLRLLRT